MPYGIIKVDTVTFTDNGVDKSISLSGLVQNPTFTGNITATGTISGDVIRGGTTISGVTVTGTTANFVSGVFTTQVSGATVIATTGTFTSLTGTTTTGTTANFASGVFTTQVSGTTVIATTGTFTSLTGTTITGTSANFASGVFTTQVSGATVIAPTGTFTSLTGTTTTGTTANFVSGVFTTQVSGVTAIATTGTFTSLTGTTTTGTTATFTSGVFTTQVSGATVIAPTGTFTSLTGTTATFTSGIIASGTAALPSLAILSDPDTGIFSPGANQLAISTNGTGRLFVDASGRIGIGTTPSTALHLGGSSAQTVRINSATSAAFLGASGYTTQIAANRNPVDGSIVNTGAATCFINLEAEIGNGNIQFCTTASNNASAVERMRLDSSGRLGLGTSSPTNTAGFGQQLQLTGNLPCISIDNTGTGANKYSLGVNASGAFGIWDNTAATYRMYINSSGQVGIGSTGPDARLLVSDGTNINTRIGQLTLDNFTGEGAGIRFSRTTSDDTLCGLGAVNAGDGDLGFFSRNNLIFATGGASNYSATTERARIDSSGRLLVGTSSASGANLLQVNSDALVYGITVGRGAGAISSNTAVGLNALYSNTTGNYNTANGYSALKSNTTGTQNTANGYSALYSNTTGEYNTANGLSALYSNTTGNYNTANGYSAGHGIGTNANTTGSNNIFIGYQSVGSSATVNNEVSIYNGSVVARFQGVASAWAFVSDARDKANIQDLTLGLDFIAALKPRKFEWNLRHTDADQGKQAAGFIAQEVLETIETFDASYTNLVDTNDPNQYTFAQSNMIPVLVNAVQELTIIVKELQLELAALKGA